MHIYKDIIMLLSYPTLRAVLQVGLQAAFFFCSGSWRHGQARRSSKGRAPQIPRVPQKVPAIMGVQ